MKTKAEQETIIRFDRETAIADVFIASRAVFSKLSRRGWPLEPFGGGWRGKVPIRALIFRRLPLAAGRKAKPGDVVDAFGRSRLPNPRDVAILGGDPSL